MSGLVRAIEMLRPFYAGSRRTLTKDLPTAFIRRGWRQAVMPGGKIVGPAYELCFFAELRDRLRAGYIWVAGSQQYRAVEDQLIAKPLFAAMKEAGPLPVSAPLDCAVHLQQRQDLLNEPLRMVADKAGKDQLGNVRLSGSSLKITPLQAVSPEAAELLADRLYGLLPKIRITDLLSEVAAWTGFSECFTHLQSGLPFEDKRVILTTVLADATNLGLTGMAEACSVATYKQLVWTAGWYLREEAYGRALARIVAAQQATRSPLRSARPPPQARMANISPWVGAGNRQEPSTRTRGAARRSAFIRTSPAATLRSTASRSRSPMASLRLRCGRVPGLARVRKLR